MSTTRSAITIRGTKSGLQIVISEALSFDDALLQLSQHLRSTDAFFQGAKVAVEVGDRPMSREQWSRLEQELRNHNLILTAALAAREDTRLAARSLGLPLVTESQRATAAAPSREHGELSATEGTEGLIIERTLRSGQVLRYGGSVVIIGDINAGAEVIADGDVYVWGSLRGMVHAGADGDENARVAALHLAPTQLRLAGYIARSPGARPRLLDTPEAAHIKDGHIVVEAWPTMRRQVNLSWRSLIFLTVVYGLEALALFVAIRWFPPAWSPYYILGIVLAAIVLGWIVAILTVNRQDAS